MADTLPDAFLEFDFDQRDSYNNPLQGESIDNEFPNRFALINFSFQLKGLENSGKGGAGGAPAGGKAAAPAASGGGAAGSGKDEPFPPVSFTMATQLGSLYLMKLCTQFNKGEVREIERLKIRAATIYVRRAGANWEAAMETKGSAWFLRYVLGGVTIASYQTSISCEDTFSLNYEEMTAEYYRCDTKTGEILIAPTEEAEFYYQTVKWEIGNKTERTGV